jgi:hypothetical protein
VTEGRRTDENTDLEADQVLLRDDVQAVLLGVPSDQRPLKGTAGHLDWRLKGMVSRFLKAGHITGQAGEIVLVPMLRGECRKTLIFLGHGKVSDQNLPSVKLAHLARVREQLLKLKVSRVAVSASAFDGIRRGDIERELSGINIVWAQ